jgi:hypothetical protein
MALYMRSLICKKKDMMICHIRAIKGVIIVITIICVTDIMMEVLRIETEFPNHMCVMV